MANSMTLLQTYCQERDLQLPVYSTERTEGSSGGYASSVLVCDESYDSHAIHSSKTLAEEDAARVAYNSLRSGASYEPYSNGSCGENASRWSSRLASRSAAATGYGYADGGQHASSSGATSDSQRRTGLAARPANGGGGGACYSRKLEQLCNSRGLPFPEYGVRESAGGRFSATVTIGEEQYLCGGKSESYSQAKEQASLIALAEVGLSLLNINEREDGTEENLERSVPVISQHGASSPPPSTPTNIAAAQLTERNYKAIVNEYCQKNYYPLPEYTTDYPSDASGYVSVLSVCDKEYRSKPMQVKKKAEQDAAGRAALDLGLVTVDEGEGTRSPVNGSFTPVNGGSASRYGNGECSTGPPSYASGASLGAGGGFRGLSGSRFSARTAAVPETITSNYKGMLQEFLARRGMSNPQYSMSQGNGGRFVSTATLTDDVSREVMHFQGKGYANKKTAEQSAAKQACIHYNLEI